MSIARMRTFQNSKSVMNLSVDMECSHDFWVTLFQGNDTTASNNNYDLIRGIDNNTNKE